jgi:glycerophosphoryl diester phosphodiesterase
LDAFAGAIETGVSHLETDLRMTSDGTLVCFHDRTVDRTTDAAGEVSSLTVDELSELDAGYRHRPSGGFPFRGKGVTVPTFEELVTSFPDVGLVVDMKSDGMASELARIVDRHKLARRIIVGSFSDRRLAEFRSETGGRVPTSAGQSTVRNWLISARMGRPFPCPAVALQVPARSRGLRVVDERLIAAAHSVGMQVHVWTVNQVGEMTRLLDMGVDGLITDRPDLLNDLLAERAAT